MAAAKKKKLEAGIVEKIKQYGTAVWTWLVDTAWPAVWYGIKTAWHFLKDKALKIWGFVARNFKKNLLDQKGRIDTGRIGQILGLVLMVLLVQYIMTHALKNTLENIDMNKILAIGGPSGLLMTLYRLKDFAGTAGPSDDQGLPGGG